MRLVALHCHERVCLGLDLRDAGDGLDLLEELRLGREAALFPVAKRVGGQRDDDLKPTASHDG